MFCPNCGSENSNERRFCFNCGRAFVRAETVPVESAPATPDRNEFIDSLSGRNEFLDSLSGRGEFLDSLSGRNEFLDSMSGFRIDAVKTDPEMIFVPSVEDDVAVIAADDEIFADEEADDVFELSLSGLKIEDTQDAAEPVQTRIEIPQAETVPDVSAIEPPVFVATDTETEVLSDQTTSTVVRRELRRGPLVFRSLAILIFGLLAFAAGSAATMYSFGLPPAMPSSLDVQVIAAAEAPNIPPAGMVLVPGGEFQMGSDEGDPFSRPAHLVTVGPFFIDRTEVTNEAYLGFVKATRHDPPAGWVNGNFPPGEDRFPVRGVTWYDAAEFAAWSGKRLPTEAEWEFAARGSDGRVYPWGNDWDESLASVSKIGGVKETGSGAKSPFGLYDMAGNVWEWTSSDAKGFSGGKQIPWSRLRQKIIRGGNWQSGSRTTASYFRGYYGAAGEKDYMGTGFRCVKDLLRDQ
jgi:formylglycine-generating enzyme required for sulfatase activity